MLSVEVRGRAQADLAEAERPVPMMPLTDRVYGDIDVVDAYEIHWINICRGSRAEAPASRPRPAVCKAMQDMMGVDELDIPSPR